MSLGDEPGRFSDFFQGYYLQKKKISSSYKNNLVF
jgi:hypothetical protein